MQNFGSQASENFWIHKQPWLGRRIEYWCNKTNINNLVNNITTEIAHMNIEFDKKN